MDNGSIISEIERVDTKLLHMCQTMELTIAALCGNEGMNYSDCAGSVLQLLRDATQDVRANLDEVCGMVLGR